MVRYKTKGRKTKRPQKEEFERLYYDCDITADELAIKYKVNKNTIYNWAFQFRKEEKN